jgi:hypothetical protein
MATERGYRPVEGPEPTNSYENRYTPIIVRSQRESNALELIHLAI